MLFEFKLLEILAKKIQLNHLVVKMIVELYHLIKCRKFKAAWKNKTQEIIVNFLHLKNPIKKYKTNHAKNRKNFNTIISI